MFIDALTQARLRASHLRHLAETLSPIFDPQQIVETLLRPFSPLFPTARGSVSLLDWNRRVVGQVWPFGEGYAVLAVKAGDALHPENAWSSAAGSGQVRFISRGQDLPARADPGRAAPPPAPFALALVPLPGRQQAHGLLMLEVPGEHTFDSDEQTFLLSLAGLAGQALDRAILTAQHQALQEELEERNIELRSYTYALSRNLGEPVQRIWNFLKLVERQSAAHPDVRMRRLFALARMEAERIVERIDELQSLTRIEQQALRPETLDLNVLLVQVRHDLEPITRKRKVQWKVGALPKIQGDALLMWQVLMELLAFAIEDAWESEQPIIRVEAEPLDGQVMLVLQSNGQGFGPELEERIFEVLDHSVPRKTAFGRLGLSNVRRALGRQGGWVRAEGRPGQGVRFSVTLPRAEEALTVTEGL